MNYLIFDSDIYYEAEGSGGIASRDKINAVFTGPGKEFEVAVIDTLQKQLVAPEKSASKKDDLLASSFTGEYVTQSERVARNLFQIIAIEKVKISEIYKYLGFENVRLVVPYGVALREFLRSNNLLKEDKRIVFLDHVGNQVLLTIFNNDIFTTPRRLSVATRRVVSEVTRSQENYKALNREEKEISFFIATNSKEIMEEIISSGLDSKENIAYFPDPYPALKGLRQGRFSMHYLLPEQFIRLRKLKTVKKRMVNIGMMLGIFGVFLAMLLGGLGVNKNALRRLEDLRVEETSQNDELRRSYRAKYEDILRHKKKVNFPYLVDSFIEALPSEYRVELISVRGLSGSYRFEAIVFQEAKDRPIGSLLLPGAFKRARIENVLVKGNPGVRVVLDILSKED
ncbi:MAG: hypothetical protein Q8O01_03450 [Candidatus Omnitrophota bacterium]|nr:hypothetical protein [Candidatus Omnitrophota bacterium]